MRNKKPLDSLFPKTRQGILAATFVQSQKSWYASEIAQRLGVPSSSLQRELRDLAEAGILKCHRQGRMVYYQANAESPLFSDLRSLLVKTAGIADIIADALNALLPKIRLAFVYGSIASGEERSDSDIDLMVIGEITPVELALPLRRARELLGRAINPTLYSRGEFGKKLAANDHFLSQVLTKARLLVLGSEHELERSPRWQDGDAPAADKGGAG